MIEYITTLSAAATILTGVGTIIIGSILPYDKSEPIVYYGVLVVFWLGIVTLLSGTFMFASQCLR